MIINHTINITQICTQRTSRKTPVKLALYKCNLTMYADDTSIFYASKNIGELNAIINRDLHSLDKWLQGNCH